MNRANFERFCHNVLRLLLLLVLGTFGYSVIEHWAPLDALFFTVTTLTTVGYAAPHELDTNGKAYTMILILFGVSYALYILADMVELFVKVNLGYRRMQNRIVKLTDHQIVCGWGRTGQEVAEQFRISKIPFVVVEMDPDRVSKCAEQGFLVLPGDASTDEVLLSAQIKKARGIVCALPDDATNTFIALTAKELNEKITIVSRAANPGSEAKLRRAGAHMVISPYVICGRRMAAAVSHPLVTEFLEVVMHSPGQDLHMEQIKLQTGCTLVGINLKDGNIKATSGAMILAVQQNGKLMTNPSPELVFNAGDELIALGTEQQLQSLASMASTRKS